MCRAASSERFFPERSPHLVQAAVRRSARAHPSQVRSWWPGVRRTGRRPGRRRSDASSVRCRPPFARVAHRARARHRRSFALGRLRARARPRDVLARWRCSASERRLQRAGSCHPCRSAALERAPRCGGPARDAAGRGVARSTRPSRGQAARRLITWRSSSTHARSASCSRGDRAFALRDTRAIPARRRGSLRGDERRSRTGNDRRLRRRARRTGRLRSSRIESGAVDP